MVRIRLIACQIACNPITVIRYLSHVLSHFSNIFRNDLNDKILLCWIVRSIMHLM